MNTENYGSLFLFFFGLNLDFKGFFFKVCREYWYLPYYLALDFSLVQVEVLTFSFNQELT